jgi:hypothetical protein
MFVRNKFGANIFSGPEGYRPAGVVPRLREGSQVGRLSMSSESVRLPGEIEPDGVRISDQQLRESLARGLADVAAGKVKQRGSFAEYTDDFDEG